MTGIMEGKRGLIMGVANDRSLAWGIAKAIAAQGGELAFSFQGEALERLKMCSDCRVIDLYSAQNEVRITDL